jgi:hypothetical protein
MCFKSWSTSLIKIIVYFYSGAICRLFASRSYVIILYMKTLFYIYKWLFIWLKFLWSIWLFLSSTFFFCKILLFNLRAKYNFMNRSNYNVLRNIHVIYGMYFLVFRVDRFMGNTTFSFETSIFIYTTIFYGTRQHQYLYLHDYILWCFFWKSKTVYSTETHFKNKKEKYEKMHNYQC